jgi:predicted nucleic acid-binding protein
VKLYLDTSAMAKLVQQEPESDALRTYLRRHRTDLRVTSELTRVELVRALWRGGPDAVSHARRQLARLYQVAVDRSILDRAAVLAPGTPLRSLDAIHLATAEAVGPDVRAVLTYDLRMRAAAAAAGLSVEGPSG